MQTSSSRRETRLENRHGLKNSVGCMSGIFHLLYSHHHNRSRKRLPSALKTEQTVISLPLSGKRPPTVPQANEGKKRESSRPITPETTVIVSELRRHSCEVPRSPTLPPEIRRSISAASPDSPLRPPALVARLMGLEDVPVSSLESAAEKRRKLLGALEKCDEDLNALKQIIETVRFAEVRVKALADVGSGQPIKAGAAKGLAGRQYLEGGDSRIAEEAKCSDINGEQPSPVLVLDAISSPRYRSKSSSNGKQCGSLIAAVGSKIVKPSRTSVFFLGDRRQYKKLEVLDKSCSFFYRIAIKGLPRLSEWKEDKAVEDSRIARRRLEGGRWRWWQKITQAMVDSVGEVWEDGVWEERCELGRVGVGLEGDIFGDLVEEVAMDLLGCYYDVSLPFGTCKKSLCF